jgi:hypothetical protein
MAKTQPTEVKTPRRPRSASTNSENAPDEAEADPAMRPFLGAARSHLDKPSNPKPEWPNVRGLYGTGAITLLARLDEAMEMRNRQNALNVDTLRAPAEVGVYKQAVLAWMDAEGLK